MRPSLPGRLAWKIAGSVAVVLSILVVPSRIPAYSGNAVAHRIGASARRLQAPNNPAAPPVATVIATPYVDAKPILEALREYVPAALKAKPRDIEVTWPDWVSHHNTEIRARIDRGDEESVVNLWHYGTSFTKSPRISARNVLSLSGDSRAIERIIQARLEDLIAGIMSPGTNERLQFARGVVERTVSEPTTSEGTNEVRRYLLDAKKRMLEEHEIRSRGLESSKLLSDPTAELASFFTLFHNRGLSSDTSMFSGFIIEQALEALKSQRTLGVGSVRRVAIVGPGLDFADKSDGHDFYPPQTIQPFALIDTLLRLGLAKPGELALTTFDLSPRVTQHLATARQRARAGEAYVVQLPLDKDERWSPALVAYWKSFGNRIGRNVDPIAPPPDAGSIEVRAVGIHPATVLSIVPQNLNIVLERLGHLAPDERFDLILGTNVLVYYDIFEQNLALSNIAGMLRHGGFFLSNTRVVPTVPLKLWDEYHKVSYGDRAEQKEFMFTYQRD